MMSWKNGKSPIDVTLLVMTRTTKTSYKNVQLADDKKRDKQFSSNCLERKKEKQRETTENFFTDQLAASTEL